uniref:non-specific serine/threonine protein kinase n=1 Tax=Strigamia maritima TaxID=126957 RepID=T1J907_STRMM
MNSLGLSLLFRMGCVCARETVDINGRKYRIRSRIAEGGFSVVDLVEDMRTHKSYALKRIYCHSKSDEKQAVQEMEFHNQIKHPFILECISSSLRGTPDVLNNSRSELLLLLPYHSRGSLQEDLQRRMNRKNHFSEEYVLRLFLKICQGVEIIHNAQPVVLAHRDLKPGNILLTMEDNPVIMDFGSMGKARYEIKGIIQARSLQDFASERCSMPYRAPELFNVESFGTIDERTDIWSLGCLLYALCFFKSPFDLAYERGDSVALAVVSGNIFIPENSPYSPSLHDLIHSLLVVNAMERPFINDVIKNVDTRLQTAINAV